MFKNDIEVYKNVITLAQVVREEYESNHQENGVVKVCDNIEELFIVTDKEKALNNYLEEQDYEVIKNIMVFIEIKLMMKLSVRKKYLSSKEKDLKMIGMKKMFL